MYQIAYEHEQVSIYLLTGTWYVVGHDVERILGINAYTYV